MNPQFLRILTTGAAILLVTLAGCGGAESRFGSHIAKGEKFFAQENYEKARVEFRNALQIVPNDAQGRFLYGRTMERLGNVREAAGMYQGAVESDTNHAAARAALGRVYVFAGAPDKALETVAPALVKTPEDPDLLTVRAAARAQLNQRAEARTDAELAVKLAPSNENAVALLASLYRQDDAPRAIELLRTTLEKSPKATELRQVLSLLYLSVGDRKGAEEQMRKIIELKPADGKARYQLAIFLTGEKRVDDAAKTLEDAIAAAPDSDEPKLVYADFLASQRDPKSGIAAMEKFIAANPDNYDLALGLGALHQRVGNAPEAIRVYQRIIEKAEQKPQGLIARNRIATLYVAQNKPEEAQKLLQEVLAENPRDNDALLLRGNLALRGNDPSAAIGDLRAVLRDQPESVAVLRTLARAHVANGEGALAEESLQRAVSLSPQDPEVRIELAQFLAQNGKSDQALPLIEQTVRDNPTHLLAREVLVRMYAERRDFAAARVAAEDLKTLAPDKAVGFYLAGVVAQAEKRDADAQAGFERALDLQPEAADALAALMRLHIGAGRRDAALAVVEKALQRAPDNFVARNLRGELHLAARETESATKEFAQVVKAAPAWTLGHRNLALARVAANDPAGATAALENGIAKAGWDFTLVADLAGLYERQKNFDKAIETYEGLVTRRRGVAAAENNLAMLLVTYRKDPKSLDRARELTEQFASSTNAALLDTHGWVLYRRGQVAESLAVLERAQRLAPDAQVVRYHLGMAQLKAGQPTQARENLQAALQNKNTFAGVDEARAALASIPGKG